MPPYLPFTYTLTPPTYSPARPPLLCSPWQRAGSHHFYGITRRPKNASLLTSSFLPFSLSLPLSLSPSLSSSSFFPVAIFLCICLCFYLSLFISPSQPF